MLSLGKVKMNKEVMCFMLSVVAAIIVFIITYQDSIQHQKNIILFEYIVTGWMVFSAVQLLFLILGYGINKFCIKNLSQQRPWVFSIRHKFLLIINYCVGFICAAPVLLQYSHDYCQSDVVTMKWYECFAQISFMFLTFSWFAFGFVFCMYAEIICFYLYKYIHRQFF